MNLLEVLAVSTIKASVLLAMAAAVTAVLRQHSAAWRHLVWWSSLAACGLLFAAPWLVAWLPAPLTVTIPVQPVLPTAGTSITVHASRGVPWASVIMAAWVGGMGLLALRWLAAMGRSLWLRRQARLWQDQQELLTSCAQDLGLARTVSVRLSDAVSVPLTIGFFRPAVVLPVAAQNWSPDRLKAVLWHEFAHIARRDTLTQTVAQFAVMLYWVNPLAWWAARQCREEQERACDERVLALGQDAPAYAEHLLAVAREVRANYAGPVVAMARMSSLEGRLRAILDTRWKPVIISRRNKAAVFLTVLMAGLPLAVMQADATTGRLTGRVLDTSGTPLPEAQITATEEATGRALTVVTDRSGEYSFADLTPGGYTLLVDGRSMGQQRIALRLDAGETQRRQHPFGVGSLLEAINRDLGEQPNGADGTPPKKLRVGGNIMQAKLLNKAAPVYPREAKAAGMQGSVELTVTLAKDGTVKGLSVASSTHPWFTESAAEAVKHWTYQPTLLNGEPVEITTVVTVNYTLAP